MVLTRMVLVPLIGGCGSLGLEQYGDTGGGGGDPSSLLSIEPAGPVSFGNVSPCVEDPETQTLSLVPAEGVDSMVINAIDFSETSTRAFGLLVSDDLFPKRIEPGGTFDFDVYFPSTAYQGEDVTGSFSGSIEVAFQTSRDGQEVTLTKTVTGTLCADYDCNGECG